MMRDELEEESMSAFQVFKRLFFTYFHGWWFFFQLVVFVGLGLYLKV